MTPAARGELGRVWRLPTAAGTVAVKELFAPPGEPAAAADVEFQLRAAAAGVVLPRPQLTPAGRVLVTLPAGSTVRAYAWVDLTPLGTRPVERVGELLATLHRMSPPTTEPRHRWFVDPVGEPAWSALLDAAETAEAPFANGLAALLPELLALEELLPTRVYGDERRCHLDLDDSNLGWDPGGRLTVLDWENSGPAAPVSELAMVAADYGPAAAVRLVRAYRDAAGPVLPREPADFATAAAVQGHLVEFYARRWLDTGSADDRHRSQWRLAGLVAAPLTRARIAAVLAAVGP